MPLNVTVRRLSLPEKLSLATRAWLWLAIVVVGVRLRRLPQLVDELGRVSHRQARSIPPERLGRIVSRVLRVGTLRPRCLLASLVLFRLLREQGHHAEIVIGLPAQADDQKAHAWIEVSGNDVGPAPGRGDSVELARYPRLESRLKS